MCVCACVCVRVCVCKELWKCLYVFSVITCMYMEMVSDHYFLRYVL